MVDEEKVYVEANRIRDLSWRQAGFSIFLMMTMLTLGVALGGSLTVDLGYDLANDRIDVDNFTVHVEDGAFNEMRGEYIREERSEFFREDKFCMYGKSNSSGLYIQDVVPSQDQSTFSNYSEKYDMVIKGVKGSCKRLKYGGGMPSLSELGEYYDFFVKEEPFDYVYLGSCHSHPPDNSHRLSRQDLRSWTTINPVKCVMIDGEPMIYTNEEINDPVQNYSIDYSGDKVDVKRRK